jgi:hypothetical protein
MRSLLVALIAAATLTAVACDTTRPVTAADRAALQQHEDQWAQRSFHSYVFDYSETEISTSYNVRITVQNDTVASVIDLQTGEPPLVPRTWPTIDDLFIEVKPAPTPYRFFTVFCSPLGRQGLSAASCSSIACI